MEDNTFSPSGDPTSLSDLLNLPESLQSVVRSLRRQPSFTLADLAAVVDDPAEAEAVLAALQEHGLLKVLPAPEEAPRYRLQLKGRQPSALGDRIWQQLEEPDHE